MGKGVSQAVANVNDIIAPKILGMNPVEQDKIDNFMVQEIDGTQNDYGWCKSKLGANAILGVSLAVCRAGAAAKRVPLFQHIAQLAGNKTFVMPVPSFNIINGGSHAGNKCAMQEFMIMPVGASSFKEAMKMASETYHHLKSVIKAKFGQDAINVGDEGGFAPPIESPFDGLDMIVEAIEKAGYTGKVKLAMDVAASEFWMKELEKYDLDFKTKDNDGSQTKTREELLEMYKEFVEKYPFVSIEDPYDQDDYESWHTITEDMGKDIQIVGDDLLVTNPVRVKDCIEKGSCNALLLKVNQIGSVTEAIEAVKMAKQAGWGVMASHRSGETEDCFIADLAVGLATGQIKTGAPCRSERLAKYNQLLRIEEQLMESGGVKYAGEEFRHPCEPY